MMTLSTTPSNADCLSCLSIRVCAPDGSVRNHELPTGQVLVVGTSPACGLRLDAPDIAGMHCTIEFNDSGITVRDWSTEAGTFLDGRQIEEERIQTATFELRIGGYLLQSRLSTVGATEAANEPSHCDESNEKASAIDTDTLSATGEYQSVLDAEVHETGPWQEREIVGSDEDHQGGLFEGDESAANDAWDRDFDPWVSLDDDNPPPSEPGSERTASYLTPDDTHNDIAELLQTEVEFLRFELAERDERLRTLEELAEFDTGTGSVEESVDAAEVEKLVARLEELLLELDQSDARIAALNDVTRTSEEAVQTADEERKQLEGWLSEVDRRVGQWEQEWQAERETLQKSIAELTEQRDRAEHQVATGETNDASGAARDQLVARFREEYSRLKSSFLKTEEERDELRSQLQELSDSDAEQRIVAAVDSAFREERLHLAQEKASLARDKSMLAKKQEELQDQLDRRVQSGESADHRIRAFREHLREIHENEPDRPHVTSLSQRMGKLWRKLEGRPLDTD